MKKREREIFLSLFLWCFFVFFITITKVKHQLRHNFIFTFSSTSRKESTNFVTFSSSLFHQLHESKASTSSRFHLHFFQKKSCMKCELASIKIVLKYVKSPICNTKTLLAEVFSTLLETRQFRCKSKYHFLKPLPLHFLINFTTAKYQLLHVFVFPFSSTSRQQSINFFTFSSSHFHQLHDSKVPTSSHFLLQLFQETERRIEY